MYERHWRKTCKMFMRGYLFCSNFTAGGVVPCPSRDNVHGAAVGAVVHFYVRIE